MTIMRVAAVDEFGPVENLRPRTMPVREPGPGEALIRVTAAAVNPADLGMCEGRYRWREPVRFPLVPGYDVAGVVEVGAPGWPVGTAVIAATAHSRTQAGGYAEYVTLPTEYLAPAPAGLDPAHAAAIPLAGLTAARALAALNLAPGRTLLVNGPHGSVGGFAVQLAEAAGVEVRPSGPVDGVLDVIGGAAAVAAFAAVRDGGRYATVVPEFWVAGGVFAPARGIEPVSVLVEPDGLRLAELSRLADAGVLRPRVARVLPLAEAAEAHRLLAAGGLRGKVILKP
ncbi:NADP-dependent oxidoreductase [Solihabitans fulvus]|uniref:NADP-dependent oxidoreductase n=1 Tax=Solihabitans fulvus TaxID=1892852 RepID=A0A5B2X265_9PSEU|nr:NADP-dependent oxidoreductase [Solihabitans fulvus]KAA2257260.1 NADP-dependent oxidoreductase [Solihabitans fulvus]